MTQNTYSIDFVDPLKTPLLIPPNTINGPSGLSSNTDIDLIGMGSSLWGEKTLENFIHMLENFSSEEDAANPGNPDPSLPFAATKPVQGQIWYNQTVGQIFVFDGSWKRVGGMTVSTITPTNPSDGDFWWNTNFTERQLHIYIAGAWERIVADYLLLDGSKPMAGTLDLGNNIITAVGNATAVTDALNLQTADARYIESSGDSMNGILNMNGNFITNVADANLGTDALNRNYADTRYALPSTNNTFTDDNTFEGTIFAKTIQQDGTLTITATTITTTGNLNVGEDIFFTDSGGGRIYGDNNDLASGIGTFINIEGQGVGSARDIELVCYGNLGLAVRGNTGSGAYRVEVWEDFQVLGGNDVDLGANRVRNVGYPSFSTDGVNMQYVTDVIGGIGSIVAPSFIHSAARSTGRGGSMYLVAGQTYLIFSHGTTASKTNNTATLYPPTLRNASNVIVAYSGPSAGISINWPDGTAPQTGFFRYKPIVSGTYLVKFDGGRSSEFIMFLNIGHE